jgi:uncharacterized protein (UPF0248 family)
MSTEPKRRSDLEIIMGHRMRDSGLKEVEIDQCLKIIGLTIPCQHQMV